MYRCAFSLTFSFLVLTAVFSPAAYGLNCPNPTPIACGEAYAGNTCDGPGNHDDYPCFSNTRKGPEAYFQLDLEHGATVEITLQPAQGYWDEWDAALLVMPDLLGDCYPSVCHGCADDGYLGDPEILTVTLPAGRHFLIVDGYYFDSCGDFDLTVDCPTGCTGCLDEDGDGHEAYDPEACPCGDDCDDNDAGRHPDAFEICGDGIDQDCDGGDAECPDCSADLLVFCGDTNTAAAHNGGARLNGYCGGEDLWGGSEYIFSYTAQDDGAVDFGVHGAGHDFDVFVFSGFGAEGVCNPDACLDASVSSGDTPGVGFYAVAGETYFISVESLDGGEGSFDYTVDCRQESCTPFGELFCDSQVIGDTTGAANALSAYGGVPGGMPGPERAYAFSVGYDAEVSLVLEIDGSGGAPPDLALLVLEEGSPGAVAAVSDYDQGAYNPPEALSFKAQAGVGYFVVVDAAEEDAAGRYILSAGCVRDCPPGQTDCYGVCADLNADPEHCGDCDTACGFDNAAALCVDGACRMGECDDGFANCDDSEDSGCETGLGTNADCGACGDACFAPEFCCQGQCVDECPEGFGDCNQDLDDGCETVLGTDENCSGCGDACGFENGSGHCEAGQCRLDSCDEGFGDCNQDPGDGCEADLSSQENCGACANACAADEHCEAGACVADCADLDGDGHLDESCGGDDCDDTDDGAYPGAEEICGDGTDQDCDGHDQQCECPDLDGDNHHDQSCGGNDCDDGDDGVHTGAEEICGDGIDQDCDGEDLECDDEGCGCRSAPAASGWPVFGLLVLLVARRRFWETGG